MRNSAVDIFCLENIPRYRLGWLNYLTTLAHAPLANDDTPMLLYKISSIESLW